jgi:hypothetical protein
VKVGDSVKLSPIGQQIKWLKKFEKVQGTIMSYTPSDLWMVKWNTPSGPTDLGMKSSDIQIMKEDVSVE